MSERFVPQRGLDAGYVLHKKFEDWGRSIMSGTEKFTRIRDVPLRPKKRIRDVPLRPTQIILQGFRTFHLFRMFHYVSHRELYKDSGWSIKSSTGNFTGTQDVPLHPAQRVIQGLRTFHYVLRWEYYRDWGWGGSILGQILASPESLWKINWMVPSLTVLVLFLGAASIMCHWWSWRSCYCHMCNVWSFRDGVPIAQSGNILHMLPEEPQSLYSSLIVWMEMT